MRGLVGISNSVSGLFGKIILNEKGKKMIIQGDQYPLNFKITDGTTEVTPAMISGLKIILGDKTYVYPTSISYDTSSKTWVAQMSQSDSLAMSTCVSGEVQVNFGGTPAVIKTSQIKYFNTDEGLFKETWSD